MDEKVLKTMKDAHVKKKYKEKWLFVRLFFILLVQKVLGERKQHNNSE